MSIYEKNIYTEETTLTSSAAAIRIRLGDDIVGHSGRPGSSRTISVNTCPRDAPGNPQEGHFRRAPLRARLNVASEDAERASPRRRGANFIYRLALRIAAAPAGR